MRAAASPSGRRGSVPAPAAAAPRPCSADWPVAAVHGSWRTAARRRWAAAGRAHPSAAGAAAGRGSPAHRAGWRSGRASRSTRRRWPGGSAPGRAPPAECPSNRSLCMSAMARSAAAQVAASLQDEGAPHQDRRRSGSAAAAAPRRHCRPAARCAARPWRFRHFRTPAPLPERRLRRGSRPQRRTLGRRAGGSASLSSPRMARCRYRGISETATRSARRNSPCTGCHCDKSGG